MTRRAVITRAAFGAVTRHATRFGWEQNILGLHALADFVAVNATHHQMFGMIKLPAHKPAIGNLWFRDRGNEFAAWFYFMTVSAAGIERAILQ